MVIFKAGSILVFLSTLLLFGTGLAQKETSSNWQLRAEGHFGFVIPEYQHFNYLVEEPVHGLELSLHGSTSGRTIWEQVYRYPEYGFSFFASSLGNKEVFGHEFALYPYVQTALIRKTRFILSNTFGLGLGYATKKFDLTENYDNISVGSHLNIHFNYKLSTHWLLTKSIRFNFGLSFTHYSNANMAEPNLGVNLFTAHAGINYLFREAPPLIKSEIPDFERAHEFAAIYAAGGKHTRALQSTVYFTSSASLEYKFHWKRKFHIGAGADLFYDSSTETEMSAPGKGTYHPYYDFRTGIYISQELVYGDFSFILQEGIYLGLTDQVDKSTMYNRAIIRWKFSDHWLISASMKSHLHILDYPELGIGYYLVRQK